MNYKTIISRIREMLAYLESIKLPDSNKRQIMQVTAKVRKAIRRTKDISKLEDLLNLLMVTIKYFVFDLEATRRENESLRELVQNLKKNN
jgi:hypothetical protein